MSPHRWALCAVLSAGTAGCHCGPQGTPFDAGPELPLVDAGAITIDVGNPAGQLPTFFEPSMFAYFAPAPMTQEFFADAHSSRGMVVVATQFELGESTSLADYQTRLAQSVAIPVALAAADAGAQVLVQIEGMPRWLSSRPSATALVCPDNSWFGYETVGPDPARWAEWEAVVASTVRTFKVDLGLDNVWYQLWDEPDGPCFWTDTQASYLELWRHTLAGARSVDPAARVGGAGVAGGVTASIGGDPTPVGNALVVDAAQRGLPLGFVSFHLFELPPEEALPQTDLALGWLRDAGLGATPIVISSHNPLDAHFADPSWPAPPSPLGPWQPDTEMGASQVLSLMWWASASGAQGYQAMYQLDDHDLDRSPYPHDWGARGPAERGGLRKALYHAHTVVGRMERTLVTASPPIDAALPAPQLLVLAGAQGNRLTVLIWRYVSVPIEAARVVMRARGYSPAAMAALGGESALRGFLGSEQPASSLTADMTLQADLDTARKGYRRAQALVGQRQAVTLDVRGFPSSGGYEVERFLIDGRTSNSYFHYLQGGLAEAQANEGLERVDARHLDSLAQLGQLELGPYAVTFLEITRPGP